MIAPELVIERWYQGKPVTLTSLRGKVVLLHLWSPYPEKAAELKRISELHKQYGNRGLVVISVISPTVDETYLRKVTREDKVEHALAIDNNSGSLARWNSQTRMAYSKIINSPLFLIDRNGMATGFTAQELSETDALKAKIERALARR